ncbi:MAG: PQQ-dependent sugar dehydrogenase [Acidobacteriota bacterium]
MRNLARSATSIACLFLSVSVLAQAPTAGGDRSEAWSALYTDYCGVCHGDDLRGEAQGTPLVGADLKHGDTVEELASTISEGVPGTGMEAFGEELTATQIQTLAIFIAEERAQMTFVDFKVAAPLEVPTEPLSTKLHDFRIETVIEDIDPLPYSIAPLPDGRILLTEKMRGLSVISPDGKQSGLLPGAPEGYDDAPEGGVLRFGNGWILDVAPHPDFADNGWIYLSYGDRCDECNEISRQAPNPPVSALKLIRGRIRGGEWVDEETIWETGLEHYAPGTDMAAGGRIAFDHKGYLYLSFGMMPGFGYKGIQDLDRPFGKVHRMHDDGRIPEDNPFVSDPDAIGTIWTYGHRSPHGLEFDRTTGELWETEMGPRGGDEVNLLQPGKNYGWPIASKGVHYNGKKVDGTELGIEVDLSKIEQPVVDLTPGVAVSSFIIYDGEAFPEWRGQLLVGSLKGRDLYRFEMEDGILKQRETLIEDMARVRDLEVGPEGEILLLLEHAEGGKIVKVSPKG